MYPSQRTWCPGFRSSASILLLLVMAFPLGGCRNCEEKFCNGIRFVRDAGVSLANSCCRDPEAPGCQDLPDRLLSMRALVLAADDACHDGNLDLLKDIWGEFKTLIPGGLILLLCDEYRDLDRWIEADCRPYVNSFSPLSVRDSVDVDIALIEVPTARVLSPRPDSPGAVERGGRTLMIAPGSSIVADTWLGSSVFEVHGSFSIGPLVENEHGFRQATPARFTLDFHDEENDLAGSMALAPFAADPILLVDGHGEGLLGVAVDVTMHSIQEEIPWSAEGFVETLWLELPVSIGKGGIRMDTAGPVPALDMIPIDPAQRALMETSADEVPPGPDAQYDPCDTMESPNGTPWSLQALDWYWLITNSHPECFEMEG